MSYDFKVTVIKNEYLIIWLLINTVIFHINNKKHFNFMVNLIKNYFYDCKTEVATAKKCMTFDLDFDMRVLD